MALQHFDGRAFSEILGVYVTAVQLPGDDAIELRGADRRALIAGRHVRSYAAGLDFERFADAILRAWEDAGLEQRYLTRPTPRLGMGTRGHARRRVR